MYRDRQYWHTFNIKKTDRLKYKMRSTLTLLGDEVCEDAVQRATVCQVIQCPGTVWYEECLIAGP